MKSGTFSVRQTCSSTLAGSVTAQSPSVQREAGKGLYLGDGGDPDLLQYWVAMSQPAWQSAAFGARPGSTAVWLRGAVPEALGQGEEGFTLGLRRHVLSLQFPRVLKQCTEEGRSLGLG